MKNHNLKMEHVHADLIRLWFKGEEILEFIPTPHGGGYWKVTETPDWSPNKKFIAASNHTLCST